VIDEVQFAASGSNIFNPVVTGIEGNSYGSGGVSAPNAAFFLSFVGRTSGGRRARLFVFGYITVWVVVTTGSYPARALLRTPAWW
jgi:hypothetical protein